MTLSHQFVSIIGVLGLIIIGLMASMPQMNVKDIVHEIIGENRFTVNIPMERIGFYGAKQVFVRTYESSHYSIGADAIRRIQQFHAHSGLPDLTVHVPFDWKAYALQQVEKFWLRVSPLVHNLKQDLILYANNAHYHLKAWYNEHESAIARSIFPSRQFGW